MGKMKKKSNRDRQCGHIKKSKQVNVPEEFPRPPSSPPSDHSSKDGDPEASQQTDWVTLRNARVMEYLLQPGVKEAFLGPVDGDVGYSNTSIEESNQTSPSNPARVMDSTVDKILSDTENYRCQLAMGGVVMFSPEAFQDIMHAKWAAFRYLRLELLASGTTLITPIPNKSRIATELQEMYGPLNTSSRRFHDMVYELTSHRFEVTMGIFERENNILKNMFSWNLPLSAFSGSASAFAEGRRIYESALDHLPECGVDQNPFTAEHKMDFWNMPRPQTTIDVYTIRNRELTDFPEGRLLDVGKFSEGYNPAVFDVGWYYYPFKVHPDMSRSHFFQTKDKKALAWKWGKEQDKQNWDNHLLKLRKHLSNFHPWGVELRLFGMSFRKKHNFFDDEPIFGLKGDEEGINNLSDIFYCQKLEDKTILFDGLLEGQIDTPLDILQRLWNNVLLLIELQPNQTLAVDDLKQMYEHCYGNKKPPGVYFAEQWGFPGGKQLIKFCRTVFHEPPEATKKLKATRDDKNGRPVIKLVDQDEGIDPWKQVLEQQAEREGEKSEEEMVAEQRIAEDLMKKYGHLVGCHWLCDD